MKNIDILIIGAGISGCVLAERYAAIDKQVLIIEKSKSIVINGYDYTDENGVLISRFGTVTDEIVDTHTINGEEKVLNNISQVQLEKTDEFLVMPRENYTQLSKNVLNHPNIEVLLETDYFDIKEECTNYENLFYTGSVNHFFEFTHDFSEKLEGRSIHFVSENFNDKIFEENPVVNYQAIDQLIKNAVDLFDQLEKDKKMVYKTAV